MSGSPLNWKSLFAILLEYGVIAGCFAWAVNSSSMLVYALCFLIISVRQHALFMIFHDAVHGHLHHDLRKNDALAYAFLSVPLLLPLHRFRALHLSHHADVGTERDPEEIILYAGNPWKFKPLSLRRLVLQSLGDLFLINNFISIGKTLIEEFRQNSKVRLLKAKVYPEYYLFVLLFLGLVAVLFFWSQKLFLGFLTLWVLPLLTTTHLLHKFRSFAEHARGDQGVTMSWQPGWFGKLILWPYNIHFHREHHENPSAAWYDLPGFANNQKHTPGSGLVRHVWSGKL